MAKKRATPAKRTKPKAKKPATIGRCMCEEPRVTIPSALKRAEKDPHVWQPYPSYGELRRAEKRRAEYRSKKTFWVSG